MSSIRCGVIDILVRWAGRSPSGKNADAARSTVRSVTLARAGSFLPTRFRARIQHAASQPECHIYSRRYRVSPGEVTLAIASDDVGGAKMHIEFGAPVFGAGGKRLGEVDGLVVNAGTKRASAILVDGGLFDRSKHMIGVSAITRSDQDGVHLDEPAAASEAASQTLDTE